MATSHPLPVELAEFRKTSNQVSGKAIISEQSQNIVLPITYFPKWKLIINGQPSSYSIDPKYGQIVLHLNSGENFFQLSFTDTPIRTFANLLSIIGLGLYIIKLYRELKK